MAETQAGQAVAQLAEYVDYILDKDKYPSGPTRDDTIKIFSMIMKISSNQENPQPSPFFLQRYILYELTHPSLARSHLPSILQIMMSVEETRLYLHNVARIIMTRSESGQPVSSEEPERSISESTIADLSSRLERSDAQRSEFRGITTTLSILALSELSSGRPSELDIPWLSPRSFEEIFVDFVRMLSEEERGMIHFKVGCVEKAPNPDAEEGQGSAETEMKLRDPEETVARIAAYVKDIDELHRILQATGDVSFQSRTTKTIVLSVD